MNYTPVREISISNQDLSNNETFNSMISNQTCSSSKSVFNISLLCRHLYILT